MAFARRQDVLMIRQFDGVFLPIPRNLRSGPLPICGSLNR
jgi:hypothetical protein